MENQPAEVSETVTAPINGEAQPAIEAAHAEALIANEKVNEAQAAYDESHTINNSMALEAVKKEVSGTSESEADKAERLKQASEAWEKEHAELLAKQAQNDRKLLDVMDALFQGKLDQPAPEIKPPAPEDIPV